MWRAGCFDEMDAAAQADLDRNSMRYDEELAAGGHLLQAEALQGPQAAVLVKVRDGRMSATDGPYAETKEQLAGFILIEARDLNEAIRLAAGHPARQARDDRGAADLRRAGPKG